MKFSAITLLAFALFIALSSGISRDPDWRKVYQLCFKLLRTSPEARALHKQSPFNPDPESQCVIRCAGIITGMYDDETGIRMKQLDAWREDNDNGNNIVFEELKMKYQTCAAKIEPEQYGDDYCKKSSKYHDCLVQRDED